MKQFGRRFEELAAQAQEVDKLKKHYTAGTFTIDSNAVLNWAVKVQNLLSMVSGPDSEHYRRFIAAEKIQSYDTNYDVFLREKGVFLAAKEDYEGGYMNSVKTLVQAEMFDDELEQAEELLANGYKTPAAVIAGVVLETTLRDMCNDKGIPTGKLDKMNADLAKANAYNRLLQKRITALADIRNSAAHGHPAQFTESDVTDIYVTCGSSWPTARRDRTQLTVLIATGDATSGSPSTAPASSCSSPPSVVPAHRLQGRATRERTSPAQ